ncbi:predicted protein, partial [Arabidopsis lyrata subsp. lyrata]
KLKIENREEIKTRIENTIDASGESVREYLLTRSPTNSIVFPKLKRTDDELHGGGRRRVSRWRLATSFTVKAGDELYGGGRR